MTVDIRPLAAGDDRQGFRSGDEALDLFFHRYAGQNQFRFHIGVTYVAVEGQRILGFATVSPATLDAENLPSGRPMPPYPVPVLRLARLAVDERASGQGLGKALVRFCIELAERLRDEVGCVGLVVDAKPAAVDFYQLLGFDVIELTEGASQQRPAPTPMFLSLGAVPPRRGSPPAR
jgi:GNAT superfamily N-acetyltransferase